MPHPQYNHLDWNKHHDIALLRLKTIIPFSDFIQPICLPTGTETLKNDMKFHIAGWGKTNICEHKSLEYIKMFITKFH